MSCPLSGTPFTAQLRLLLLARHPLRCHTRTVLEELLLRRLTSPGWGTSMAHGPGAAPLQSPRMAVSVAQVCPEAFTAHFSGAG